MQNFFIQSLPLNTSSLFSILLKEDLVDIEKPNGIWNMNPNEFSGLFLHPSIFSNMHSRSAKIVNGALSDSLCWSNSNILVSSEGIIMLEKSLFSHTLLCNWSLFSVAKEWKTCFHDLSYVLKHKQYISFLFYHIRHLEQSLHYFFQIFSNDLFLMGGLFLTYLLLFFSMFLHNFFII